MPFPVRAASRLFLHALFFAGLAAGGGDLRAAAEDEPRKPVDFAVWPAEVTIEERSKADRSWWSLRPLADVAPPAPSTAPPGWADNPIDRFLAAELVPRGLHPNSPADRRTLIRRATHDLTGLPPTPEEVAAFVADAASDADEKLVDRLLASPRYGERWGRHWLDVVRFGESVGFDRNALINDLWPFRDWVIASINADTPFDPITPADYDRLHATFTGIRHGTADWTTPAQKATRERMLEQLTQRREDLLAAAATAEEGARRESLAAELAEVDRLIKGLLKLPQAWIGTRVAADAAGPFHVFLGGSPHKRGDEVVPASPEFLADVAAGYSLPVDAPEAARRAALADWIVAADNPLTPRVLVNRLWHHHFGTGIVATPNDFLPAEHQAIVMAAHQPIRNIRRPEAVSAEEDEAARTLLAELNRRHAAPRAHESELNARIAAYELAARMQLSAPEVRDLAAEPAAVHRRYGTDSANPLPAAYARNCLLARRLIERGVRYVNLYCASRASGVDGLLNWDAHKTLRSDYERHCPIFDQPTAALLADLKASGLLADTLVLWTTEFGRMPTHQSGTTGRDHNPDGFTLWMMGAGVKAGVSHGATDEFGRRAVEHPTTVWDFYATVLHILGFDHTRLTWYHNGLDRRLTDVHGRVISEVLA